MDYSDVVSAQVFLTDITQFKRMNAVYASVFKTPRPARVTVGVAALAVPNAHVEIMVTAQRQASKNKPPLLTPGLLFVKHDHMRCVVNARDSESLAIRRPIETGKYFQT